MTPENENVNSDSIDNVDYDAILIVSFGGPEQRDDVMPFLENVLRGRNVPRERMLEVAEHYYHFDGVSPINQQCRDLIGALRRELDEHSIDLPIYWGNRNWDPLLTDTMAEMAQNGVSRVLAFVTSAYSSYSGCRQYLQNIDAARQAVGRAAPAVDKLRMFYNHPDFVAACTECLSEALEQIPSERRTDARLAFTAHSIPNSTSDTSDYVKQLTETCRLASSAAGIDDARWELVYQSRSGPPHIPWLEPDIVDHLQSLQKSGVSDVVVMPIGFLSDHMEVLYDLDHEAAEACAEMGLNMVRAETPGMRPGFVAMIRKLIQERIAGADRESVGRFGPNHDVCPADCCPSGRGSR